MKTKLFVIIGILLSALLSGCVGNPMLVGANEPSPVRYTTDSQGSYRICEKGESMKGCVVLVQQGCRKRVWASSDTNSLSRPREFFCE